MKVVYKFVHTDTSEHYKPKENCDTCQECSCNKENSPAKESFLSNDHPSKEKMIWARVRDDQRVHTSWIPALVGGGRVLSAVGEIIDPDSPDDTREFDDCPIPGYRIVKDSIIIPNSCMARIAAMVTPVGNNGSRQKPFMYVNEFPVHGGLTDIETEQYLIGMVSKFMFGRCEIEPIYWEYLSYLNGATRYTPKEYVVELDFEKLKVKHFLVTYTVTSDKAGNTPYHEYSCIILDSHESMNKLQIIKRLDQYINGKITVNSIEFFDDIISSIAVIL